MKVIIESDNGKQVVACEISTPIVPDGEVVSRINDVIKSVDRLEGTWPVMVLSREDIVNQYYRDSDAYDGSSETPTALYQLADKNITDEMVWSLAQDFDNDGIMESFWEVIKYWLQ